MAAIEGQLDRRRNQRGSAQYHRETDTKPAGRVSRGFSADMPLLFTDEQIMLRDNTRGFLSKNAPVAHLRHLRDSRDPDGFSRPLWKDFVEMGWAGILVPQEYD